MTHVLTLTAELSLLLAGYWLVDLVVRQEGLRRLLVGSRPLPRGLWTLGLVAVGAALSSVWRWSEVPEGEVLRVFATLVNVALAWRAATRDVDVVHGERQLWPRAMAPLLALASYLSPGFMLSSMLLLTTPFGMWQHHATLPMRVLQALVAFAALSPALAWARLLQNAGAAVLLMVTIQASHYLITALAKGFLGPHWYSWMFDNRLHHIGASAYSWGWARFIPWARWRAGLRKVEKVERPLQVSVFGVELLAPLALLHPFVASVFGLAWAGFHLGVFALSGLLFWEWIFTDIALAIAILQLTPATQAIAFGAAPALLGTLLMVIFPLRHKLWKPMPLGWWDTPFTQRMHWVAIGESGARYGLYANTMDPHERIYGKVHGCFMAPAPVLTYHLGEAWRHELRDGLRESGGDLHKLNALRREFGIEPRSDTLADSHRAYLRRFAWALNHGAKKAVLPGALRWLKAPGGQCFYWGELPRYQRQEAIRAIEIVYREEFFDGEVLQRVRDEVVEQLAVPQQDAPPPAAVEPTPKQLDDHLLRFAAGRLIRLPGFGDDYLQGDDGARTGTPEQPALS